MPVVRSQYRFFMIISAVFFWKRFCNAKSDPKSDHRGVVLVIPMPGEKGSGMPFWLAPF
jgi:hypothetical protein